MKVIISKLPEHEWRKYRDIRLLALKTDPDAFCSTYKEEVALSETEWRRRIEAMWFAKVDANVVGLVGLLARENDPNQSYGDMVSLWVNPQFRGQGAARLLVAKLQALAPSLSLGKIALQVNKTQLNAIKLYERMGFRKLPFPKEILPKYECVLDRFYMEWRP